MIQNKPNTLLNQLLIVLLAGTITAALFTFIGVILPKPDDGIPWAQNTQGITALSQAMLNRFLRIFTIMITINLIVWSYCKARNIQNLSQLVVTMLIASSSGIIFSALPVAYDAIWTIVIKLHLKRQDQSFDTIIALLYNTLTIGMGVTIGIVVSSLLILPFREKRLT